MVERARFEGNEGGREGESYTHDACSWWTVCCGCRSKAKGSAWISIVGKGGSLWLNSQDRMYAK